VTGLSKATIVVEAALKSGSLISAKLALAEGREVMAVPGLVTNLQARGCHHLIRE
jgi:DNA processing protein